MNTSNYDTLVISGGSIKAILALGALQYCQDSYLLKNIKNYVGTSCGAIICYLIAIGYTPIEIMVYLCTNHLLDKLQHFNIVGMINGEGASSFSYVHEQLEKMSILKIGSLPTLGILFKEYGKKLVFATHNLSRNETEYLSWENYPDLPCLTAIRMSSNLPFIFEKFKYGDSFYIDGGISANFPIEIADKIGSKILGLKLGSENDSKEEDETGFVEFVYKLMFIPIDKACEYTIKNCSERCKIVRLNFGNLKFFNFNVTSKTKLEMFSNGYQQIKDMLEN